MRQWLSVDLMTGAILAYLPGIEATDSLRRTIGAYDTASVKLHVTDDIDPSWERAIQPGATALICFTGESGYEVIEWGGIVLAAPRDLTAVVQISLVTPDGYLDRCYVGDTAYSATDQNTIATDLVESFAANTGRIPWLTQVVGAAGTARDRTYADADNKTVYSALQEISGVSGGPEWVTSWVWDHGANTIFPQFSVGTRIGNAQSGPAPNVTFEAAFVQDATVGYDYTLGNGANVVTCYSTQADSGPATETASDLMGRPLWEYRFSPSTSILHTTVLDAHAVRALARMQDGAHPITITMPRDQPGYTLGVDWDLGDDIGYHFEGAAFPTPISGVVRVIAVETTPTTVTPTLAVVA